MIKCINCYAELEDDAKFCSVCGAKVEEKNICEKCGTQLVEEALFCPECGTPVGGEQLNHSEEVTENKTKKNNSKQIIIVSIACIVSALLVLGVVSILLISKGKKEINPIFYIKEDELFASKKREHTQNQITKNLFTFYKNDIYKSEGMIDGEEDWNEYLRAETIDEYKAAITGNGKTIVYMDRWMSDEDSDFDASFSLFYRDLGNRKEPVEIDKGVIRFQLYEKSNKLVYEKQGELFLFDFKEKHKIASNVKEWKMSKEGNTVIYLDEYANIYCYQDNEEKVKIAGNVNNIKMFDDYRAAKYGKPSSFCVSEDFKKIYYITVDGILYGTNTKGEKETIATGLFCDENNEMYYTGKDEAVVCNDGSVYYSISKYKESNLSDYIEDDLLSQDSAAYEPEEPEEPKEPTKPWFMDDEAEAKYNKEYKKYEKALKKYEKAYGEYESQYEVYEQAVARNEWREILAETPCNYFERTYYYFNGTESVEIGKHVTSSQCYFDYVGIDASLVVYKTNEINQKKIKISEIEDIESFTEYGNYFEKLFGNEKRKVAIKGRVYEMPDGYSFVCNQDGSKLAYQTAEGELMQIDLSEKGSENPRKIMNITSDSAYEYLKNGQLCCINQKDDNIELVVEDKIIADFVKPPLDEGDDFVIENNGIYFISNMDSSSMGTLCVYVEDKVKELAYDVYDFRIMENGDIYYLKDYSVKYGNGDLYYLGKNGKSVLLDTGVNLFIPLENI